MLNDSSIDDPVDVDAGVCENFARRFHSQPNAAMGATRNDGGGNPFVFCNLMFDCDLKVGICLADAENMVLGALDAESVSPAFIDFNVVGRDERFDLIHIPGVDDFLYVTPDDVLVLTCRHWKSP